MSPSSLAVEARLLLLLARPEISRDELERGRSLLTDGSEGVVSWGTFLDLASRHKVLPLVASNFIKSGLARATRTIPYPWVLRCVSAGNRARNAALRSEFRVLLEELNRVGIPYAIRKGPVIGEHLYRDAGLRRMNDLDLLVLRSDLERIVAVLEWSGYQQGRVAGGGKSIERFDRRTEVFWRLNVNNALPYIKLAGREELETYCIDLCFDLFQQRSAGHAETGALLTTRIPVRVFDTDSFALDPIDQLIDVCVHLYKEATSLYFIQEGSDLQVSKFLDVALVCEAVERATPVPDVLTRVRRYGAEQEVYYALHHAAMLYPERVSQQLLDVLRPAGLDYLDEYGQLDGNLGRWEQPFLQRLFDTDRSRLVSRTTTVPKL